MTLKEEVLRLGDELAELEAAYAEVLVAFRRVKNLLQNSSLDEFEEDGPTTGGSGMQATVNMT